MALDTTGEDETEVEKTNMKNIGMIPARAGATGFNNKPLDHDLPSGGKIHYGHEL